MPHQPALIHQRGKGHGIQGQFDLALADYLDEFQAVKAQEDGTAQWEILVDLGFLWAAAELVHVLEEQGKSEQANAERKSASRLLNRLAQIIPHPSSSFQSSFLPAGYRRLGSV